MKKGDEINPNVTKNAPQTIKRKVKLNFFCDMGVPKLGEGGLPTWELFPLNPVFGSEGCSDTGQIDESL